MYFPNGELTMHQGNIICHCEYRKRFCRAEWKCVRKIISEGCSPSFFSVVAGFNQPLHVSCFMITKFTTKRKCNKSCPLQKKKKKKKSFYKQAANGEEHFVFKDSGNNERCWTGIPGEWSSRCHWLIHDTLSASPAKWHLPFWEKT